MAKANYNKRAMILNLVLVLSLFLVISMAESRKANGARVLKARKPRCSLECESVFGVESGDTCFGIAQLFSLTTEVFDSINPNLNCEALFVGQWLCVAGSPC
ncbi:hypothetical protein Pint_27289 [Pistacia integerrima]|uniref:Uncharacterized protein n=1 Tax=Pistacia integerrima TaxID=434235 RepID=A0ACC0YPR2_9ROSI|nr:hypothetical protein Pint_27289 [Pistacia integerrima]